MDLVALTAFQLIAEQGGISPASRASAIPKTTLSRRLRQLEEELGVTLVERGPRLFRLTDEGIALHERTRTLLTEIDEAGQTVAGGLVRPRGRLRVSAPTLFTDIHIGAIAAAFAGRYPEIVLEIVSDNRVVDPLHEGFDAVIRVNPDAEEDMVGRLLYRDEMLMVSAMPIELAGLDEDILIPAIILPTSIGEKAWSVEDGGASRIFLPQPVLRMTSVVAARQAVLAGAGAALLPRSLIADDLLQGRITCYGRVPDRPVELWVLHRSRRLRSPKVAAFVDHLSAAFADRR